MAPGATPPVESAPPTARGRWEIQQLVARALTPAEPIAEPAAELSAQLPAQTGPGERGRAWLGIVIVGALSGAALAVFLLGSGSIVWNFWAPTLQSVLRSIGAI
jgi:hypothetical protein